MTFILSPYSTRRKITDIYGSFWQDKYEIRFTQGQETVRMQQEGKRQPRYWMETHQECVCAPAVDRCLFVSKSFWHFPDGATIERIDNARHGTVSVKSHPWRNQIELHVARLGENWKEMRAVAIMIRIIILWMAIVMAPATTAFVSCTTRRACYSKIKWNHGHSQDSIWRQWWWRRLDEDTKLRLSSEQESRYGASRSSTIVSRRT
jgi:hypothetical protein